MTPCTQMGIIRQNGLNPDQDGLIFLSQTAGKPAGAGVGNPLGVAICGSDLAVQRGRDLCGNERQSSALEFEEDLVERPSLRAAQPAVNFQSCAAQLARTASGNLWIGVLDGVEDAADARRYDGIRTRRRSPLMAAGLQGDVESRTPGPLTRLPEGFHFSVRTSQSLMEALPDPFGSLHQNASYPGVGESPALSPSRQAKGFAHVSQVVGQRSKEFLLDFAEQVPQFVLLDFQVGSIASSRLAFERNSLHDGQAVTLNTGNLLGIIGEQVDFLDAQVG